LAKTLHSNQEKNEGVFMKISKNIFGLSLLGAGFVALATYSSFSINSDSFMNDNEIKFVKNRNSLTGTTIRAVASLKPIQLFGDDHVKAASKPHMFKGFVNRVGLAIQERVAGKVQDPNCAPAVISQDLDLSLSEVYSPKKFAQVLTKTQFDGSLSVNSGMIDSMDVKLPNSENISMNNVKMCGNLFSYEISGEKYSGMIFTTDNKSFMVSLTEGPFDGTRLKFDAQVVEEVQAETTEVAEGAYEQNPAQQIVNAQPMVNTNNYEQDPQAQQPQMVQNQFVQQPMNGEAYSAEEIEGQVQNNGFNFAPPAEAQM
jgi:hypothetical protein